MHTITAKTIGLVSRSPSNRSTGISWTSFRKVASPHRIRFHFFQRQVSIGSVASPTVSTEGGITVPRRRFQRPSISKRGKKPVWIGKFREDQLQTDGTIKRVQRKVTIGPCDKVSQRAAYAAFQPYLDAVNIAPAPPPRTGKTFVGFVPEWREQIAVHLKPSTVRAAESHLKLHLLPRMGSLRLQEMPPQLAGVRQPRRRRAYHERQSRTSYRQPSRFSTQPEVSVMPCQ